MTEDEYGEFVEALNDFIKQSLDRSFLDRSEILFLTVRALLHQATIISLLQTYGDVGKQEQYMGVVHAVVNNFTDFIKWIGDKTYLQGTPHDTSPGEWQGWQRFLSNPDTCDECGNNG